MAGILYFAGSSFELPDGSAKSYSEYMERLAKMAGRGELTLKNGNKLELYLSRDMPWAIESDER